MYLLRFEALCAQKAWVRVTPEVYPELATRCGPEVSVSFKKVATDALRGTN